MSAKTVFYIYYFLLVFNSIYAVNAVRYPKRTIHVVTSHANKLINNNFKKFDSEQIKK